MKENRMINTIEGSREIKETENSKNSKTVTFGSLINLMMLS